VKEDNGLHGRDRAVLRRNRLRRFRRIPLRFVLPNLVTLLAICLGLTGVRFAIEGHSDFAVYAIISAAILDGLDGRIARALKGTSRFGAELDSLADFVDFGVAPALVLYLWSLHEHRSIGWFAALIFAIAGALRLARFNVMIDDPNKPAWSGNFFVGMPAPAGAILVMLPLYLHFGLDMPNARAFVPFEIAYVLFIAFLMASGIPHFSGKRIGRVPREWFIPVLLGIIAALLLVVMFTMQMLIVLSLAYLALIPLSMRRFQAHQRADEAAMAASAPVIVGDAAAGEERAAGQPPG
jgi:CDP-diacylglycerol--serine O-phosphatidyltransferase